MEDPHALKIYIDGNCYKNPGGAGGYAGMAVYPDDWNRKEEIIFQKGFQETTNNRMELSACIDAYEYVRRNGAALGVERVQIVTDSMYVYQGLGSAPYWKQGDWKTRDGRAVENEDLWKKLLSLRPKTRIRTEVLWKKGKKDTLLKAIDWAAKEAGKSPWEVDRGFRVGKVGRSEIKEKSASQLFKASGQQAIIRVYRSGVVGRSSHKIYFDLFSESAMKFEAKFRAAASDEIALELHRGHIYRVRFNLNPKNPIIEDVLKEIDKSECGL